VVEQQYLLGYIITTMAAVMARVSKPKNGPIMNVSRQQGANFVMQEELALRTC
jgi:hypothetical protein